MRRYIEIISIALISSYITLAVLYLINNEIFQDISISNNSEEAIINSVNKDLSDLEEELSNLIVKVDSIETSLDAINIQDRSEVTVSEGVSAEVPQEFLNKVIRKKSA
jgi:peptidoglycan hydrolase CwlO-like protein